MKESGGVVVAEGHCGWGSRDGVFYAGETRTQRHGLRDWGGGAGQIGA
jgi:hypothetical protein